MNRINWQKPEYKAKVKAYQAKYKQQKKQEGGATDAGPEVPIPKVGINVHDLTTAPPEKFAEYINSILSGTEAVAGW